MVELKRVVFNKTVLDRVRKSLRTRSTAKIFNGLPLDTYARWIINRFQKESGRRAPQNMTSWLRWIRAGNHSNSEWAAVQMQSFAKGWVFTGTKQSGGSLEFVVNHRLSEYGWRGEQRFWSIVSGTSGGSWEVDHPFKFKVSRNFWMRFQTGQMIEQPATEGNEVISKVSEYVHGWLAQRMVSDLKKVFL